MIGRRRSSSEAQQAGSAGILIVDDTPSTLLSLQATLGDLAQDVVIASSASGALRALLSRSFGIIILDFQLPDLNGLETARLIRARERCKHIPIIFLTGYSSDQLDLTDIDQLGAVDFMLKPVQPEVLRARVSALLGRRVARSV